MQKSFENSSHWIIKQSFVRKPLGHPKVNNLHIKNCRINTNDKNFWAPLVYGDGEHLGNLPVDIKKGQKRLKVLVANNENSN